MHEYLMFSSHIATVLLLLAITASFLICNAQLNLPCPISQSKADILNKNGLFSYPFDVYATSLVEERPSDATFFPCNAVDNGPENIFNHTERMAVHNCSLPSVCPWRYENIEYSTDDMMGKKTVLSAGFCRITSKLFESKDTSLIMNNHTTNIYIFGGSVTLGDGTAGYECQLGNINGHKQCISPKRYNGNISHDKWFPWWKYFELWLQSIATIPVIVHNVAGHGHSTTLSSHDLSEYLIHHQLNLTSDDIIFLDFSVNDGMELCYNEEGCRILLNAQKQFLVTVHNFCINCLTIPSIILFETFPKPPMDDIELNPPKTYDYIPQLLSQPHNYLSVYHKFSNLFHIPKWSFYNVIFSNDFKIRQNPIFGAYFKWFMGQSHHQSWHIHLAIADLYASTFIHESYRCLEMGHLAKEVLIPKDVPKGDICDSSRYAKSILDITSSMYPHWEYAIGKVSSIPSTTTTWLFQDDGRGRYGWMIQNLKDDESDTIKHHLNIEPLYLSPISTSTTSITTTSNSDSISASSSRSSNATLIFYTKMYLNRIHNITSEHDVTNVKRQYSLDINYIRSYENFGLADVYLDNVYLTTLDGLWDDLSKHVSVPQVYTKVLPIGSQPESISIIYRPIHCHLLSTIVEKKRCHIRNLQKMRIIGVRICSPK